MFGGPLALTEALQAEEKNNREGVLNGKSSKRQKACGATRTQ
jgi:hypothetical protein